MSTNDKTNPKLDKKNNDDAIVEVSATEADAVAGGAVGCPMDPQPTNPTPGCDLPPR